MGLLTKQSISDSPWSLSYGVFLQIRYDFERAFAIIQPLVSGAERHDPLTRPDVHA